VMIQTSERNPMTTSFDYPVISWLGTDPFSLPVYSECFDDAGIEIMGESPYINAKGAGISFALTQERRIKTVFLYSQGFEGFSAYAGALPLGLTLNSSRAEVRAAMGDPAMSGEKGGVGIMTLDFSFDRFEKGEHYLNFRYLAGDKAIQLIVIGLCSD
jgi:hypothetical protein